MTAQTCANAKSAVLVGNAEDTITMNAPGATHIEVINLSTTTTDIIWCRWDGSVATVNGDDCVPIPANSSQVIPGTVASISLISVGTPRYCVTRLVHS